MSSVTPVLRYELRSTQQPDIILDVKPIIE